MRLSRKHLAFVVACVIGFAAASTLAQNVINNPGFETAPTAPPTPNDWQYFGPGSGRDSTNPHNGSFEADLNNVTPGNNANVQEQTAFGSVTAGLQYTLSFYSEFQGVGGGIGQAQFEFMNSTGGILPGYPQFINLPTTASDFGIPAGYQLTTQEFTAPANASAVFLSFNAVTGANTGDTSHAYVDDVSVAAPAVPEPASLGVLGVGVVALLGRRRRSR